MSMLSPTRLIYVCFTDRKAVALTMPFLERDDMSRGYLLACYLCLTDTDAPAQPQLSGWTFGLPGGKRSKLDCTLVADLRNKSHLQPYLT
jgi:hypothetical protein